MVEIWNVYKLRIINYELQITNYELKNIPCLNNEINGRRYLQKG